MGSFTLREILEEIEIDAVSELDRQRYQTDEEEFMDRMDQAANNSRMESYIPSAVGTKFSTPWKRVWKESIQCTNEISIYYTYRDEDQLGRFGFDHALCVQNVVGVDLGNKIES